MSTERVLFPQQLYPSHYSLELVPDLEKFDFTCNQEIDVTVKESTNEVTLHTREIFIESVCFKSASGKKEKKSLLTNFLTITSIIRSRSVLVMKSFQLVKESLLSSIVDALIVIWQVSDADFSHSLPLSPLSSLGFYRSSYSDVAGNKKIMASTQFEALDARRAFPCWDEPAVKATFTVSIVVPSHLTALSNMPEVSSQYVAGGKKKVVFEKSPKMSTYLLAWAVGEFDFVQGIVMIFPLLSFVYLWIVCSSVLSVFISSFFFFVSSFFTSFFVVSFCFFCLLVGVSRNGVSIRVFAPPGRAEQGKFALDAGLRSLDFYDDFFAVSYPLPKLDMLCVTEFAMGAMENWGLVTYRENALMIDEAKASPQSKQRVAIVVAHELGKPSYLLC
jgi:aminopeptidase N